MIKTVIRDLFKGYSMKVEQDGAINAYLIPRPPINNDQNALPFAEYMRLDGTGATALNVNGSVVPQDFYVSAKPYDIYVNSIVFTIADAGALLNQFGALTALTNGLEFYYYNQSEGKYTIESGLKSNFDMIRLANFEPSYGSGNDAMRLTNVVGAAEAVVGVIDMEDVFGLQWGLKLRANTTDRVGFIVNDNITLLDGFDIKVYGIRV